MLLQTMTNPVIAVDVTKTGIGSVLLIQDTRTVL